MGGTERASGFLRAAEPFLRKVLENIESPFVWMPLGLFILCVLAYPISGFQPFLYLSTSFVLVALGADWVGRWRNRQTPPTPVPQKSDYREHLLGYLNAVQRKAVGMILNGKTSAARALTEKNLEAVDNALIAFPDDPEFHSLMGYVLKDMYQTSKGALPTEQRQAYLARARASFEHALGLKPDSAGAHNGMANVLFFEGHFDESIREHERAIVLAGGNYRAAELDMNLVTRVKNGEIPFDF